MKSGDLERKRLKCPEIRKGCHVSSSPVSYQRTQWLLRHARSPHQTLLLTMSHVFQPNHAHGQGTVCSWIEGGCCLCPSLLGCFVAGAFFHVLKPKPVAGSGVKELAGTAGNSSCFDNRPCCLLSGNIWEFLLANVEGPGHWISPVLLWY